MAKPLLLLFAGALALGTAAPAAAVDIGFTEDEVKSTPGALYAQMAEIGATKSVISISWDADNPTALPPDTGQIAALLPVAAANGVSVTFAVYQKKAAGLSSPAALAQFGTWIASVARTFPAVREFIGPNEPNQPRFWQPQFNPDCTNASAAAYLAAMATMYDALKGVDGGIKVTGLALSPRGNDDCSAPSNVSTSPVRFLIALGKAYRVSGRRTPIMDGLSFHPYPNVNTDPPSRGYVWPNVGVPNLDRMKQAFYDAFNGTGQPATFGGAFRITVDELGWQADTASSGAYNGVENVPTVDEATQARYYSEAIELLRCDPAVEAISFFHLVDEADRDRWQSGVLRADRSRRPSFDAVKSAIAGAGAPCRRPVAFQPSITVQGATPKWGKLKGRSSPKRTYWSFHVTAAEEATYTATIRRKGSTRAVLTAKGKVKAKHTPLVRFPKRKLKPGSYVYAITLRATTNTGRVARFTSPPFRVG